MKATGIVRRIDELGRVVIPKEIRRTLRIREGDPLEIFTDRDELMLKKYSPIATLERFSEGSAKSLNDLSGYLAVICDTDEVLYASGEGRKEINRKPLSAAIEKILKDRRSYLANASEGGDVVPLTSGEDVPLTAPGHRADRVGRRLSRRGGAFIVRRGRENRKRRGQTLPTHRQHSGKSVRLNEGAAFRCLTYERTKFFKGSDHHIRRRLYRQTFRRDLSHPAHECARRGGNGHLSDGLSALLPFTDGVRHGHPFGLGPRNFARRARGDESRVRGVFLRSLALFSALGLIGFAAMLVLAPIMSRVQSEPTAQASYVMLAPSVFFVSVISCFRGYYQGKSNFTPTAVSEFWNRRSKWGSGSTLPTATAATCRRRFLIPCSP